MPRKEKHLAFDVDKRIERGRLRENEKEDEKEDDVTRTVTCRAD